MSKILKICYRRLWMAPNTRRNKISSLLILNCPIVVNKNWAFFLEYKVYTLSGKDVEQGIHKGQFGKKSFSRDLNNLGASES